MNDNDVLRKEIEELERKLKAKRQELAYAERSCRHQWSEPQADHTHQAAYTIPGDPPGTCGVDWRGPVYVPSQTTKRWKRTCARCGKVEHTTRSTQEVKDRPNFG